MLKRLFNPENDTYNEEGKLFNKYLEAKLKPIIDSYIEDGYSGIDLEQIISNLVGYWAALGLSKIHAKEAKEKWEKENE